MHPLQAVDSNEDVIRKAILQVMAAADAGGEVAVEVVVEAAKTVVSPRGQAPEAKASPLVHDEEVVGVPEVARPMGM